jgi:hypothetical protein
VKLTLILPIEARCRSGEKQLAKMTVGGANKVTTLTVRHLDELIREPADARQIPLARSLRLCVLPLVDLQFRTALMIPNVRMAVDNAEYPKL